MHKLQDHFAAFLHLGMASASKSLVDDRKTCYRPFRQLPCRTYMCVGACPYRERCVFLHDPRLRCPYAKPKSRRKCVENMIVDAFFWPTMDTEDVSKNLDSFHQPHVCQQYEVPPSFSVGLNMNPSIHDQAVFSMWNHFADFCASESLNAEHNGKYRTISPDSVKYTSDSSSLAYAQGAAAADPINPCTGLPRLRIFVDLSRGISPVISEPSNRQTDYQYSPVSLSMEGFRHAGERGHAVPLSHPSPLKTRAINKGQASSAFTSSVLERGNLKERRRKGMNMI